MASPSRETEEREKERTLSVSWRETETTAKKSEGEKKTASQPLAERRRGAFFSLLPRYAPLGLRRRRGGRRLVRLLGRGPGADPSHFVRLSRAASAAAAGRRARSSAAAAVPEQERRVAFGRRHARAAAPLAPASRQLVPLRVVAWGLERGCLCSGAALPARAGLGRALLSSFSRRCVVFVGGGCFGFAEGFDPRRRRFRA